MKIGANLKRLSQYGLFSESREYEVEIASNRAIEWHGEEA